MKNKLLILILLCAITVATLIGCGNAGAKNWGGTTTLDLPANEKLVMITWKDDSLWYLSKPMTEDDVAETYKFKESSNFGIIQGTVIVNETKK